MASRSRHARPRRRRLQRAGLTLTVTGIAALSAAGAAQAAVVDVDRADPLSTVGHLVDPVANLRLNPMANTGVDPLNNGVGTQIADFKEVNTQDVTAPLAEGASLADLTAPLAQAVAPPR